MNRRIVIGTVEPFEEESVAFKATAGLRREINSHDFRLKARLMTVAQLVEHYRQRELPPENEWKTYSTRTTYIRVLEQVDRAAVGKIYVSRCKGHRGRMVAETSAALR